METGNDKSRLASKFKAVGGTVEKGETAEKAAGKEVAEEVGQRILDPTEKLLVVHKISNNENSRYHQNVFFVSGMPLIDSPLKLGTEIAEAVWMSADEIKKKIWENDFIGAHAAAFLWFFVRERYLKTNDESVLRAVLTRVRCRSWSVDENVLTICTDPTCAKCAPKPIPTGSRPHNGRNNGRWDIQPDANMPPVEKRAPAPNKAARKPIKINSGIVNLVLISQTRFEDFLFMQPVADVNGKFVLPVRRASDAAQLSTILKSLGAEDFQMVPNEYNNEDVVVAVITEPKSAENSGYVQTSLNTAPPYASGLNMYAIGEGLAMLAEGAIAWFDHKWLGKKKSNWIEREYEITTDKYKYRGEKK
ncbi:MAG: NUDIX hydrolase [bacterium]|nr:NUDIX hydrolase [bacterium]